MSEPSTIVNDITEMNPIEVEQVVAPTSVDEVVAAVKSTSGSISIGGGRFSMGGQTACEGSLHLDMRQFNKILDFSKDDKTIRVQTGITWRDIQEYVDVHDLSIKIMQTYSNFTVGGSLSVNVHGRYMGLGPVILSVRSFSIVTADGSLIEASPDENSDVFYGAIGGYGGLGVLVEATLELEDNVRVERISKRMPNKKYLGYFKEKIRDNKDVVFHNADSYPPRFDKVNAVTWIKTDKEATVKERLQPVNKKYPLHSYFMWAFTETPFGKWRREFIVDPLLFSSKKVHWRNYEASYDVAELQPIAAKSGTFVLQEYFVPVNSINDFAPKAIEIFQRHNVNVVNISVRHAIKDPGSFLAWAREEVFAFVLYCKQGTEEHDKNKVAVWTRELIDSVIESRGAYYLPYQPHATPEQFHKAYPGAEKYFDLKRQYDPSFRFRNTLWNKYYRPTPENKRVENTSEFLAVDADDLWSDKLYRFLQVVFNLYPEDRFHALIKKACRLHDSDQAIYQYISENLKTIKPGFQISRYIIPAIRGQKTELTRQTLELLGQNKNFKGYVEIGATGFYASELSKHLNISGNLYMIDYRAPTYSPADMLTRGRIGKIGRYIDMNNYDPISPQAIPDASVDLVTCYIGLHHCAPDKLGAFIKSIARILRSGGHFIVRDHSVDSPEMNRFVSHIHTVFNAGTEETWETNEQEPRFFNTIEHWCQAVEAQGFRDLGHRLLQKNDPSDNVLMAFEKKSVE